MQIRNTITTNAKMEKWAGVMVDGWKLPLIFVEMGSRSIVGSTKTCLKPKLSHGSKTLMGTSLIHSCRMVHQHTAVFVQDFWKLVFPSFCDKSMWAPSSPDLKPMDFSMWSIFESRACRKPHQNTNALKIALLDKWENIPEEMVCSACAAVPSHLCHVIKNRGYHCENAWNKMSSKQSN